MPSRVALALSLACAACGGDDLPDDPIPALPPRAQVAACLAALELPDDPAQPVVFPPTLSATGCFSDLAPPTPAPDLIPFRVISPLWTDGVVKQRFMAIPPGRTIGFTATGGWSFPERSVLVKNFILETEIGVPDSRRPVETRLMLYARGEWSFASYRWNDEGSDAALHTEGITVRYEVRDGEDTVAIDYDYPSEMGCVACHAEVTGEALGPRTEQLNQVLPFETGYANQLVALAELGLFDAPLPSPEEMQQLPRLADPSDDGEPLERRARSYLHSNCAHCHQPGGHNSNEIDIDLRIDTPLADARLCNQPISHTIHVGQGALVIDPGVPENSNLYGRMLTGGLARMPPLGRSLVDPVGLMLVREWIAGMTECP